MLTVFHHLLVLYVHGDDFREDLRNNTPAADVRLTHLLFPVSFCLPFLKLFVTFALLSHQEVLLIAKTYEKEISLTVTLADPSALLHAYLPVLWTWVCLRQHQSGFVLAIAGLAVGQEVHYFMKSLPTL